MSTRKAVEIEMKRYETLATRLEQNLKNVTQTLVTERDDNKLTIADKKKTICELERQNIEFKATNKCLEHSQKMLETRAFPVQDQGFTALRSMVEAATNYAKGDQTSENNSYLNSSSETHTPRPRNSTSAFIVPTAPDAVVNLVEDDVRAGNSSNNRDE